MGITVGAVIVVVLAVWGFSAFSSSASSPANRSAAIEQLATAGKLPEALTAVEKARQTSPNDPDLLVWEGVLAEKLNDSTRAKTDLAQAQQKFSGTPVAFWTLVGNRRLLVGNLPGAEAAGQQALALAPQDPQVTFLLGGVAEARGDNAEAASYFSQTVALAGNSNPQLGVIAKVRMGYLSQRVSPLPGPAATQTITPTLTPK